MKLKIYSIFGSSRSFIRYSVPSVFKSSDSGSALILVLLITALLATIAVSFLSTSRIEQMATRNFTRQNAASGLAELATQLAMAKIKEGFTINGTDTDTTIITTQPGAIWQYTFSNGTCSAVSGKAPLELFTTNGSIVVNLNNLENPSSSIAGNSTITGNNTQAINVYMKDVTATVNGSAQVIGRYCFYVDDELTKLNINGASANRSTLNSADSRSFSLTTINNNATMLSNFSKSINGTISDNSNIASWGYFFRPEQATAKANNTLSLNKENDLQFLTALPLRDFHMKYTPWGARRLFINDTQEVPLDSKGVDKIATALSDRHLRNIYGQTYADKYTIDPSDPKSIIGLKQIAANMLQRKFSKTSHHTNSYTYSGPLIGGDKLEDDIPSEYLGHASYPGLNEVGISARLAVENKDNKIFMTIILQVCIETIGWQAGGAWMPPNLPCRIIVDMDTLKYTVNYSINGTDQPSIDLGGSWPVSETRGPFQQFCQNSNSTYTQNFGSTPSPHDFRGGACPTYWGGNISTSNINIYDGGVYRYHIGTVGGVPSRNGEISMGFSYNTSSNITIKSIKPMVASIKKIRLLADWNDNTTIRDWVLGGGKDIGDFNLDLDSKILPPGYVLPSSEPDYVSINATSRKKIESTLNIDSYELPFRYNPESGNYTVNATITNTTVTAIEKLVDEGPPKVWLPTNATTTINKYANGTQSIPSIIQWNNPEPTAAPSKSYGRLEPRLRSVSSLGNFNPCLAYNKDAKYGWAPYADATWGASLPTIQRKAIGATGFIDHTHGQAGNAGSARIFTSNSSWTKNNKIPGDPMPNTWRSEAIYDFFMHNCGFWFPIHPVDPNSTVGVLHWPYYSGFYGWTGSFNFVDSGNNTVFIAPRDLGTIVTNYPWRSLRMQVQPKNEISSTDGGGNMTTQSLIPDWAMLDIISFGMNSTTIPFNFSSHVNLNNKFHTPSGTLTSNRTKSLESLLNSLNISQAKDAKAIQNPYNLNTYSITYSPRESCNDVFGNATNSTAQLITKNIGNATWSSQSLWGTGVRKNKGFPVNKLVLPSELAEIKDIADLVTTIPTTHLSYTMVQTNTSTVSSPRHIKCNEIRLSPFFPGATLCSNFFTIYAYAQSGQLKNKTLPESSSNPFVLDSEALTKTLVEVEIIDAATSNGTKTTPPTYKVKKLYTQPIPLGQ